MTWLTWRQYRVPVATLFAIALVIGGIMLLTASGLDVAGQGDAYLSRLHDSARTEYVVGLVAVYVIPGLVGVFWGAPLVAREVENGTHRLVWNQTVTRGRWLAVKIGVGAAAAMAIAGLTSLSVGWWSASIDAAAEVTDGGMFAPRVSPEVFGGRGVVPMAYAVFALVLGVAVGVVLRRTVAAMAVTFVLFVAVQVLFPIFVRPHILPPLERTTSMTQLVNPLAYYGDTDRVDKIRGGGLSGVWTVGDDTVDAAGNVVTVLPAEFANCMAPVRECLVKLDELGYQQRQAYQPASRFWALQVAELGIFLAMSGLLTWFTVSWSRRRLS
jgi:ABC-type transport system involved in multi-copper enzyme maturation permease subunit